MPAAVQQLPRCVAERWVLQRFRVVAATAPPQLLPLPLLPLLLLVVWVPLLRHCAARCHSLLLPPCARCQHRCYCCCHHQAVARHVV